MVPLIDNPADSGLVYSTYLNVSTEQRLREVTDFRHRKDEFSAACFILQCHDVTVQAKSG